MRRRSTGKALLWAALAVPAVVTAAGFAVQSDMLLADLLHPTGEWSARLMILALMFAPLALLFPNSRIIQWLVRHRRSFGVGAFCYALLHLVIYLVDMGTIELILAEIGALGIWTGWVAFVLMLPLALTSNARAMEALGGAWKRLQRLAYPAALFTLIHWMFIHDGLIPAIVNFVPLILLQLARIVLLVRRSKAAAFQGEIRMKFTHLSIVTASAFAALAALAGPAQATGKMTCNAGPQSGWKSMGSLQENLTKQGWKVTRSKVDGGCYEVYGTDPEGRRVEAYFHPVTFEKLLVSRRGEVLFKKQ